MKRIIQSVNVKGGQSDMIGYHIKNIFVKRLGRPGELDPYVLKWTIKAAQKKGQFISTNIWDTG